MITKPNVRNYIIKASILGEGNTIQNSKYLANQVIKKIMLVNLSDLWFETTFKQ